MEGAFETTRCDKVDEVLFAANQLRDRAKDWCELLKKEKGREGIRNLDWDAFKEIRHILCCMHFPASAFPASVIYPTTTQLFKPHLSLAGYLVRKLLIMLNAKTIGGRLQGSLALI